MPDYVVYHNPDKRGFSAAECTDFRVLANKPAPNEVIGSRIWLLTGEGRPRKYYLASTFIAENVTHDDAEGFQNCISAAPSGFEILKGLEVLLSGRCSIFQFVDIYSYEDLRNQND